MASVVGSERVAEVRDVLTAARDRLDGRRVWHVSDTHTRGGVAELLHGALPYFSGEGIATRWTTLDAPPEFREFTKNLYYRLCGVPRPTGPHPDLGRDRALYEQVCRIAARHLICRVDRRDLVVLHDHHTAGLIPHLREAGCTVLWRAHIGTPLGLDLAEEGWAFLRPYLQAAHAYITSCDGVLPEDLDGPRHLVPPSINPLSPKNLPLDPTLDAGLLLAHAGITHRRRGGPADPRATLAGLLLPHPLDIVRDAGPVPARAPLITQVSRWDGVKGIPGVISAFAEHVDPAFGAHLVLVGPRVGTDRQAAEVFEECRQRWEQLGPLRDRVHLVQAPPEYPLEHALLVNAVQRCSTVVIQKSLVEGFGLTVSEAAWKGRPVVASPVGGLLRQVEHGSTGMLLAHPNDLQGLGDAVNKLLADPALAAELGAGGRRRVLRHFLTDSSLANFSHVLAHAAALPAA